MTLLMLIVTEWKGPILLTAFLLSNGIILVRGVMLKDPAPIPTKLAERSGAFQYWGTLAAGALMEGGINVARILAVEIPDMAWPAWAMLFFSLTYALALYAAVYRFVLSRPGGLVGIRWAMACVPFVACSLSPLGAGLALISGHGTGIIELDANFKLACGIALVTFSWLVYFCVSKTVRDTWKAIEEQGTYGNTE